jgi:uncharacterized protein
LFLKGIGQSGEFDYAWESKNGGIMSAEPLTHEERCLLLEFARRSIDMAANGLIFHPPALETLSPHLRENGVCFVTLTLPGGELRGCIGGLEATQPLVLDVCEHAVAAARDDYRFLPVRLDEIPDLTIEISRLTPPEPLMYDDPAQLSSLLHPMEDGVILRDGTRRATFLPQVWEKLPAPESFLTHLCQKMGAPGNLWRHKKLQVDIYHAEKFEEE